MQIQTAFFGLNQDYSNFPVSDIPLPNYNEIDVSVGHFQRLESERGASLDDEGKDENGECGASIQALILICDDQTDPFYYEDRDKCLRPDTFADIYKENFKTDDASTPPVVYFNLKNFTHPFSSSCDMKPLCGVSPTWYDDLPTDNTDASNVTSNGNIPETTSFVKIALAIMTLIQFN